MKLAIYQDIIITNEEEYKKWAKDHTYIPKTIKRQKTIMQEFVDPVVYPHIGEGIDSGIWDGQFNPQKVEAVTYYYTPKIVKVDLPFYCASEDGEWDENLEEYVGRDGWKVV